MEKRDLNTVEQELVLLNRNGYAQQGCELLSGSTTVTGNFYGFSIGATKPTTLKITTLANITLNGTALAPTDDIISFVSEGEFVPINFTSITITGSGYIKCYKK